MNELNANDERQFLSDIARELNLSPLANEIFIRRCHRDALQQTWNDIASQLNLNDRQLRDCWSQDILRRLQQEGLTYEPGARRLWITVREWLSEHRYPQWLWGQLEGIAAQTHRLGVRYPDGEATLNMSWELPNRYLDKVTQGETVICEVDLKDLEEDTHLLLIERDGCGQFYCLCPSLVAPKVRYSAGIVKLPQHYIPGFQLNAVGEERLLAFLTPTALDLPWLEQKKQENPPQPLAAAQLAQLRDYASEQSPSVWLSTYEVVAP